MMRPLAPLCAALLFGMGGPAAAGGLRPSPVTITTSRVTTAAKAEQAALCGTGAAFPARWTWDPAQTTARPRAAVAADHLTPKIEQYRAGKLIATWKSFGSNPATCDFGTPDATHPVDLQAAANKGCGPFGNISHVDLWNTTQPGDRFLVYPAVYTGLANDIVLISKADYWTGPVETPTDISITGVAQRGVRPVLIRNDGGPGDFATAQAPIYFANAEGVRISGIDVALGAAGTVGKAGIYVNTARNVTLSDMRIHEFAWQGGGSDGQNGVFSTGNASGTLLLSQIEAYNNGGPNGPTHNFYINASTVDPRFRVVLRNSWSHDAVYGHTFKSRAQNNLIEGNYFQGGVPNAAKGQTQAENYLLDLPNGGRATIRDNVFVKTASGPNSNAMAITFAMEGMVDARAQSVSIRNNSFVAFAQYYDGSHPLYPLSFFYPNVVPGTPQWPQSVAYDIADNLYAGYCPTDRTYLPSGNYRGALALTTALSDLTGDFSPRHKFEPAGDSTIIGQPAYAHRTRAGIRRTAATIGARD